MAKPSSHLNWTDGAALKVTEPTAGKKLLGWIKGERPAFQFWNWTLYRQDEWNKYFETTTDNLVALQSIYDYVIGVGGTHATLNDLIADAPPTYSRVYVKDAATLSATQVINVEGMEIQFDPRAHYAKGGALVIGLQIAAPNITIIGGRWLNFDEVGGKAIDITVASNASMIKENRFDNNTEEISDAGTKTLKVNNIVE